MKSKAFILILVIATAFEIGSCNQTESKKNNDTSNKEVVAEPQTLEPQNTDVAKPDAIPDELAPENYKSSEIDLIGWELMEKESFGDVKLNMDSIAILKILGKPDSTTTISFWGVDGGYHNEWIYTNHGLIIGMNRIPDHSDSNYHGALADRMTLTSTSNLMTNRRIHIGSSKADVLKNYKMAIEDTSGYNNHLTAGTAYGGLIFEFENEKVINIFLGAAAE